MVDDIANHNIHTTLERRPESNGKPPEPRRSPATAARARAGFTFVSPAMLIMLLLVVYPLVYGIIISFFDTNLLNRWDFVGFKFFNQSLSDPGFVKSLVITVVYALLVVSGHLIIGVSLAVALASDVKFNVLWRAILILPWLFPEVVVAMIFRWIFDPLFGILNYAFQSIGVISTQIAWLDHPTWAFVAITGAAIWKGYPLVMLLALAGLQSIPRDRYEAAALDGANRFLQFRYVSLPGLAPILGVAVILEFVWWFKHFTIVWLMTKGGPVGATNVVSIDIYRTAFQSFDFGRAAAMAVIVLIICIIFAVVYRRMVPDDEI